MISNLIVILSMVFAGAFFLAWLLRRDVREQIEQPKHGFQDRVLQYDRQCHQQGVEEGRIDVQE
ncbi:MAG: hypothetical protein IIB77_01950 [Proteobacteria bacterium]|nr:hypothetical protein [Pseudomonadota bacterium]